ncbi:hypothetical protein [Hafnia alvei]|uniref:hypothetical protein n=1 Tax=Hafnia alvei TaxID=569 RepID=UPI0014125059|nr:hypothetical protein [Hafnia alvei]QIP58242.1 hypothetical protein HBA19_21430 [Hafnia alvei]
MPAEKVRHPSPLQRRVLIVLAAMEQRGTHRVRTRDLEHLLAQGGEVPVYGPNLRASCRRMETAGWLRTLRAPNLQLAVELTETGRELAVPLLIEEQDRCEAERRASEVRMLPMRGSHPTQLTEKAPIDIPVELDGNRHSAWRGIYVIRLDGSTCLQLWNAAGHVLRLEGDPLQVATWLQACHDAGLDIRVQINESPTQADVIDV